MRVLYVIDSLAPGGAERSFVAVAPRLLDLGVDLRVVTIHDRPGISGDLLQFGVEVCSLPEYGRSGKVRRLSALVRASRPDLVHTTLFEADIIGRLAALLARVPSVSTLSSASYGSDYSRQPGVGAVKLRAAQALDSATARFPRRFHAVSDVVATAMSRRLLIPRRRVEVVHRGRDPDQLGRRTAERSAGVRASLGLTDAVPLLVAVARHEYDKGLDVVVEAMAEIRRVAPGAVLVVAGREGNQTQSLKALSSYAGPPGTVRLLGPRADVADLLAAADVFVAPSRREGLPGAVLEALALEAPIVASDIPAVREAVGRDRECALLVAAGSCAAVTAAVAEVLRSAGPTATRVEAGRRRFELMFTIERAAAGMLGFYQRALGG